MDKEGYKDTLTGSRTNTEVVKRGTKPNSDICRQYVIFVKWFSGTSSYLVCLTRREVKLLIFLENLDLMILGYEVRWTLLHRRDPVVIGADFLRV